MPNFPDCRFSPFFTFSECAMFAGVEILNEHYGSSNGQNGEDLPFPEIQVSKK